MRNPMRKVLLSQWEVRARAAIDEPMILERICARKNIFPAHIVVDISVSSFYKFIS